MRATQRPRHAVSPYAGMLPLFALLCFHFVMTSKPSDFSDLNALAIEACDMWQEHLSNLASNADARAELTRFLEPQRRLFADWTAMMKPDTFNANAGGSSHDQKRADFAEGSSPQNNTAQENAVKTESASHNHPATAASASSPRGAAHGDDSLRVAQLALRVAELEKRLAKLEAATGGDGAVKKPSAARGTQRTAS